MSEYSDMVCAPCISAAEIKATSGRPAPRHSRLYRRKAAARVRATMTDRCDWRPWYYGARLIQRLRDLKAGERV
jgi:formate-dependent nitrite reductase cytochrome c552 subunit